MLCTKNKSALKLSLIKSRKIIDLHRKKNTNDNVDCDAEDFDSQADVVNDFRTAMIILTIDVDNAAQH